MVRENRTSVSEPEKPDKAKPTKHCVLVLVSQRTHNVVSVDSFSRFDVAFQSLVNTDSRLVLDNKHDLKKGSINIRGSSYKFIIVEVEDEDKPRKLFPIAHPI